MGLSLIIFSLFVGLKMGSKPKSDEQASTLKTFKRKLLVFDSDSLVRSQDYILKINEKEDFKTFAYLNPTDTTRNFYFKFLKNSGAINSGLFNYSKGEKIEIGNIEFTIYNTDEKMIDAPGPLYFNEGYGVLFQDNGWLTHFYFICGRNINDEHIAQIKKNHSK